MVHSMIRNFNTLAAMAASVCEPNACARTLAKCERFAIKIYYYSGRAGRRYPRAGRSVI